MLKINLNANNTQSVMIQVSDLEKKLNNSMVLDFFAKGYDYIQNGVEMTNLNIVVRSLHMGQGEIDNTFPIDGISVVNAKDLVSQIKEYYA
jgi:hypothetical protein